MDLPFVCLDAVYHLGELDISDGFIWPREYLINWHFECGLFSVSLDPEAWRPDWGTSKSEVYELRTKKGYLNFLDADLTLQHEWDATKRCALRDGLIKVRNDTFIGTDALYRKLSLNFGTFAPLAGRSNEAQLLQASLAVLALKDPTVHGLWWSDLLDGGMRTERGGIHQSILPQLSTTKVVSPTPSTTPAAILVPSSILI